jgi:glycosyltransferase involved in cell wall biosynthesis
MASCKFVFVVTGVGYLGISNSVRARAARWLVFGAIRRVSRARAHFVFENSSDPTLMGIPKRGHRMSILMGAGIDPHEFYPTDLPNGVPFRFATVSRLVWSKGIDLAAEAISSLAQEGYPVELHIYGAPDVHNPRPIDPDSLSDLRGVHYHGFSNQVADIWQSHHAAIFASRGGEGLPRALLEAAACGRPSIVTAVPGCADFVRDGIEGYVVPLGSDRALKQAIVRLITDRARLAVLGWQSRNRVLEVSTNQIVQDKYEEIFHALLQKAQARDASDTTGSPRLISRILSWRQKPSDTN